MPAQYQIHTPGSRSNIVPITEPLHEDQTVNSAGGYVWAVDNWTRARRFLILGSEGGSYYASERQLTAENAKAVIACLKENGQRMVDMIVEVSERGLAPKNDPAIFALALACSKQFSNVDSWDWQRDNHYATEALPRVCRTATHLFTFCEYVQAFRGWGRGLRNAVAGWYTGKSAEQAAYQMVKYRQRNGWSHRDLLRLAHPKAYDNEQNAVFHWAAKASISDSIPPIIPAFEAIQRDTTKREVIDAIHEHNLTREMLPTHWLNDRDVWAALLEHMPMTAMIRNLGKMSAIELIKPNSDAELKVIEALSDVDAIKKARVHPIAILTALKVYEQGHGDKGSLTWRPAPRVLDALDEAFYLSFQAVEPANKRFLLALDVSGSMGSGAVAGVNGLTPRIASAAMALVTARTEKQYDMVGFSHQLVPINLTARTSLSDAVRMMEAIPMGGTDCAVPMLYAMEHKIAVDTFVVYTDSETWCSVHPVQMLQQYRDQMGIPAQLIVVGMVSNGFTIADPDDKGMLDVVGFDSSAPAVMAEFARGNI